MDSKFWEYHQAMMDVIILCTQLKLQCTGTDSVKVQVVEEHIEKVMERARKLLND